MDSGRIRTHWIRRYVLNGTQAVARSTALVPLAGNSAGSCCGSTAALGGRAATVGFGVKPRENEEDRGGEAAPRSGAKRRPDFWRAVLEGRVGLRCWGHARLALLTLLSSATWAC